MFSFKFGLTDALIQSDLQYITFKVYILSVHACPRNRTPDLGIASIMFCLSWNNFYSFTNFCELVWLLLSLGWIPHNTRDKGDNINLHESTHYQKGTPVIFNPLFKGFHKAWYIFRCYNVLKWCSQVETKAIQYVKIFTIKFANTVQLHKLNCSVFSFSLSEQLCSCSRLLFVELVKLVTVAWLTIELVMTMKTVLHEHLRDQNLKNVLR